MGLSARKLGAILGAMIYLVRGKTAGAVSKYESVASNWLVTRQIEPGEIA